MARKLGISSLSVLALAGAGLLGCEDPAEITLPGDQQQAGGKGGASGAAGSSGQGGASGNSGSGGSIGIGGMSGMSGAAGSMNNGCNSVNCPADKHCEIKNNIPTCVNNTCADVMCSATEACVTKNQGEGKQCVDISCNNDVDCPAEQFCNGTICVDDICKAGESNCNGNVLEVCASNGGSKDSKFTCGSTSYYTSMCTDDGMGDAYCPCQDDWDCPENTVCEVDRCVGTGKTPTCSLPPEDFSNVLPSPEITWGGTVANKQAQGSAFPNSSQVVLSPLVVNLDDDNGDGLINERDFPEIVFTTFCNSEFTSNGTLRAIHGGGANKGKDYFAACAGKTWHEGEDPNAINCGCSEADLDSTASLAAGDLDNDGVPEIVAISETNQVRIYSRKGDILATSGAYPLLGANPAPTLANIDNQGLVEIVIGRGVITLGKDAMGNFEFVDFFNGNGASGVQGTSIGSGQGAVSCVANLVGDSKQEIVGGSTVYRMPAPPAGVTKQSECTGMESDPEEVAFCNGNLMVVWDGQAVNGSSAIPNNTREGFCAVADVLGMDQAADPSPTNALDQVPEVVLIANGRLLVFNGQTGTLRRNIALGAGARGGPPNVDDFDGDGFPEIGSAFGAGYLMMDLQSPSTACPAWPNAFNDANSDPLQGNPARTPNGQACTQDSDCGAGGEAVCNTGKGQCVCLHNGWRRVTEDNSSRVTGSSVFDFNGDRAAEVIYNDECNFRVYDGVNGAVLFKEPSESRTRIEYPIVADVDNDGNSEIVFATTNESGFCSENKDSQYNNGIEVWGDAKDTWVSARRIWNQHAYHVTNVFEGGGIPTQEPESWKPYNGRFYNTYRSNPRSFGVAPDLEVTAMQVSSPDAQCGQLSKKLTINVQVANKGDLRVGPGVVIGLHGVWNDMPMLDEALHADNMGTNLTIVLQQPLEPGDSVILSASYDSANNSPNKLPNKLPNKVRAVVDETNAERECKENNNTNEIDVVASSPQPDLTIALASPSSSCPSPTVQTTVSNIGTVAASNIVVRYFAGDPSQGAMSLGEQVIAGPLNPGGSTMIVASMKNFPSNQAVLIYGVVDPDNAIAECNDANNTADAMNKVSCGTVK